MGHYKKNRNQYIKIWDNKLQRAGTAARIIYKNMKDRG